MAAGNNNRCHESLVHNVIQFSHLIGPNRSSVGYILAVNTLSLPTKEIFGVGGVEGSVWWEN